MSFQSLANLAGRLWKAVSAWPTDDPLRARVAERLLASGLAPDAVFEEKRDGGEAVEGVNFYRCLVRQPLDERWSSFEGRLSGQDEWPEYQVVWGVLARDEEEAGRLVLAWQSRCYPLPATMEAAEVAGEGYKDKPGVVWQGYRWPPEPASVA